MYKRKEIKFRDRGGYLVGRQNGMIFYIMTEPGLASTCAPTHYVEVDPGCGQERFSTMERRYFYLSGAKEFCQEIAAGELRLEDLRAEFAAESAAKERETMREAIRRAKLYRRILEAKGLSYRELLDLEAERGALGDLSCNIIAAYERGEGWPDERGVS